MKNSEIDVSVFLKQEAKKTKIPIVNKQTQYLSVKEYAKLLGVSTTTVYQFVRAKRIEGVVKFGGKWLIPVEN